MFYLYLFLIALLSLIIQSSPLLDSIRIIGLKPNFILPLVVYCGYRMGKMRGIFIGLILGSILEMFCSDHLGIMTLSYGLIGGLAGLATKQVVSESWLGFLVGIFSASVLEGILINFVGLRNYFWSNLWLITLPGSIYNLISAILLFWLLHRIPKGTSTVPFEEYKTTEQ
jgi:rod shape-determining protein MreD